MKISTAILVATLLVFAGISAETKPAAEEGPGTYEILDGNSGPVRIPFRMVNGKPVMDLKINGRPASLMIDNGILWDQVWLFGSPLVDELGLEPVEHGMIGGAGEGDPTQAYSSTNLTLAFEDIVFRDQLSLVSPASAGFARIFPGVDGQLCNTFFKHFVVEFDFIRNEVLLHDPRTFRHSGFGSVLDMKEEETGPHSIPLKFVSMDGREYIGRADIDFGGIYAFTVGLNTSLDIPLPEDVRPSASRGAQGRQTEFEGKVSSFTIGDFAFHDPVVHFADGATALIHPDSLGVVGLPLFMEFRTIFDYINMRLYLQPTSRDGETARVQ